MKLHESTESKITKDKNGENVSHLEITELVLVQQTISFKKYLIQNFKKSKYGLQIKLVIH